MGEFPETSDVALPQGNRTVLCLIGALQGLI
jgi:hypothetical protein